MPCCQCWDHPQYQWINRWILLGLTVVSWILSIVTMARCEFYQLSGANNEADGIGLFRIEDGQGGCQKYEDYGFDVDGPLRTAKAFATLGNLALVVAFILSLAAMLGNGDRQCIWDWAKVVYCCALFCVFLTFSIGRSEVTDKFCGDRDDCSFGTAGAANVINIFFLLGIIITACFVPAPAQRFSGFSDCGCSDLPTTINNTPTLSSVSSLEARSQGSPQESTRMRRLESNVEVLFHQTDEASAKQIERDGKMRRGSTGLVGGGIYFTKSQADTHQKAHRKGYMVIAFVKLGRVKTVSSSAGDSTITFRSLLAEGYDSVQVNRSTGTEYVIYNWDQAKVIKVTKM